MIKTHIESFAKYAGIATVSIEWTALLSYYLQLPQYWGGKYPISYYATLEQTRLTFTISYILAAICFWIFIRHYVSKHYKTPIRLFGLSLILFIGVAIFPYNPNSVISSIIHGIFGYGNGIAFIIAAYILGRNTSKAMHRISAITLILSFFFFFAFAIAPKESYLIFAYEALGWLMLQMWILWISFYILKEQKKKKAL